MYDSILSYVEKKSVTSHLEQSESSNQHRDITDRFEWKREECLYLCEYVENPGAINVWLARYHGSTPLEKEDVIFMIVKTSSLRNKSDEEAGGKPGPEIGVTCSRRFSTHPSVSTVSAPFIPYY